MNNEQNTTISLVLPAPPTKRTRKQVYLKSLTSGDNIHIKTRDQSQRARAATALGKREKPTKS